MRCGLRKELLEAAAVRRLDPVAEMWENEICHSPQWEVAGILLPVSGDVLILAALFRNLKELPGSPGIAIPYKLQKAVAFQHTAVLFAVEQTPDISRQFQILRTLLHKLTRQRIEHPQPGKVAA